MNMVARFRFSVAQASSLWGPAGILPAISTGKMPVCPTAKMAVLRAPNEQKE
jgi:hypothetical protein